VAVGGLGVDTSSSVGFDLYSELREIGAGVWTTEDVHGWASLDVAGTTSLYSITPFSGAAQLVGSFDVDVTDIAIPLHQ
jgi:hypothetical protein